MERRSRKRRAGQSGASIVETAFMVPWLVFLFVGILDLGFYSYAAIATQNAARAAAIRTSYNQFNLNANLACAAALAELQGLPNLTGVTTCGALPVIVTVTELNAGTTPPCADCGVNAAARSALARVTYQTLPMIPIPGLLMGQLTLSREAEARILQK